MLLLSALFKENYDDKLKGGTGEGGGWGGVVFGSELQTGNDPTWRSSAVTPIQSPHLTVLTAGCRHVAFVISAETQSASRGQLPRGRGVLPHPPSPPIPLPHPTLSPPVKQLRVQTPAIISESEGKSGKKL